MIEEEYVLRQASHIWVGLDKLVVDKVGIQSVPNDGFNSVA